MVQFRVWIATGLSFLLLTGCVSTYDPDVHPLRLVTESQKPWYRPVDLDGNGRDELVRRGRVPGGVRQSVVIETLAGRAVAQVNFPGEVLSVRFQDLNQNGRLELIVPVREDDSLYYNVLSNDGRTLRRFFAIDADPDVRNEAEDRWDVRGAFVRAADVTGDGENELISFLKTGFARQPRGIWVHSYPEGDVLGRLRIGALPDANFYFGDADADGRHEWFFGSKATNNGARAAGMTDARAYVGAIEVTDSPRLEWAREMGGTFAAAEVRHGDIDGEGQIEILALRMPREGRQTSSPLQHLAAGTGDVQEEYVPTSILRQVRVGNLDQDRREEIVVLDGSGSVRVLDEALRVTDRRRFDRRVRDIQIVPDFDGDGAQELVAHTEEGSLWLSGDLSTVGASPLRGHWRIIRTGRDRSPKIAVRHEASSRGMSLVRVEENPFWWIFRYGPATGLVVSFTLLLAGSVVAVRRYQTVRVREAIRQQVLSQSDREWVLIHPDDGIEETSPGLSSLLNIEGNTVDRDRLRGEHPELVRQLDQLAAQPVHPKERTISANGQTLSVTFTPLEVFRRGRPYWLVWFDPASPTEDEDRVQGLMAQRVAHDLKNPLTSILLTLQRMQMAYQEENGELEETLDQYTERIEDRISSLRRMTTNVLKFVDKEELRRTRTNVNGFLDDLCDTLETNLPPDIELHRAFDASLPSVAIDRDQMQSVIENLVTNGVEAMPEGGRLTITTRLARDLCLDGGTARDYVVVEVQDTGVGMTLSERERIFDPGFSTRDDTGLGMALVRKVIEDHDGDIEVESEPDIGTSITLYLPAANAEEDT